MHLNIILFSFSPLGTVKNCKFNTYKTQVLLQYNRNNKFLKKATNHCFNKDDREVLGIQKKILNDELNVVIFKTNEHECKLRNYVNN